MKGSSESGLANASRLRLSVWVHPGEDPLQGTSHFLPLSVWGSHRRPQTGPACRGDSSLRRCLPQPRLNLGECGAGGRYTNTWSPSSAAPSSVVSTTSESTISSNPSTTA